MRELDLTYNPMSDQSRHEHYPSHNGNDIFHEQQTPKLSPETEPIPHDIVVIANRALEQGKAGGLVGAMLQYSKANEHAHITSIGWDGKESTPADVAKWKRDVEHWKGRKNRRSAEAELEGPQEVFELIRPNGKISVAHIPMTTEEIKADYADISNNWLWKVLHSKPDDFQGEFSYDNYVTYDMMNERFADAYVDYATNHPALRRVAWLHDYQRMLIASKLRAKGVTDPIGQFMHIPFPKPEMLALIPEKIEKDGKPPRFPRREILEGLMGNDLVGFQTRLDASNFLKCIDENFGLSRNQVQLTENGYIVQWGDRKVRIGSYPIGVDAESIREKLDTPEVRAEVEKIEQKYEGKKVIFDASRLDISKGIEAQLMAYRLLLEKLETKDPALLDELKFVRIIAPSREMVPGYKELRERVFKLADEINEQFANRGHGNKVEIIYDNRPNEEVLAFFEAKTTHVAMITPEIDGMNLVVKEAAAARNKNLRFVVSTGAGASHELKGMALRPTVSKKPEDVRSLAMSLYAALTLPDTTAHKWKDRIGEHVTVYGVIGWGYDFLRDLEATKSAA